VAKGKSPYSLIMGWVKTQESPNPLKSSTGPGRHVIFIMAWYHSFICTSAVPSPQPLEGQTVLGFNCGWVVWPTVLICTIDGTHCPLIGAIQCAGIL
jgi:hypothetical protein